MKEIKAYIRRERATEVVAALRRTGATDITLLEVHAVGYGEEPNYFVRDEDVFSRYHAHMVKLEIVCADQDLDLLTEALRQAAYTGNRGDGMIFVADMAQAVRIRDGAAGESAL